MERKRVVACVVGVLVLVWPVRLAGASTGSVDQGFGRGGVAQTDISGMDVGLDVLVQPDRMAVTLGFADFDGILLRHRPDGTLDPGFGVGGVSGDDEAQVPTLARYLPDASLDPAFGSGGSTRAPLGAISTAQDLIVDAAGRLLTAGTAAYANPGMEAGPFSFLTVSRFSPDGIADGAFGCAGSTQVEIAAEVGGRGTGIAVAADGRIVVGGIAFTDATTDLGRPDFLLVRLLADGGRTEGYWVTRADGGVSPFGTAGGCGSLRGLSLNQPIVGHAARASGDGYWFVASDGGVFTRGDAPFLGSAGGIPLNRPVVGMAATPSGNGYWLVASDGGIFAYGDAGFHGSTGGVVLDRQVVGIKATPAGAGYWLAGADGGIFAFGNAPFLGSTGGEPFPSAAVAIT